MEHAIDGAVHRERLGHIVLDEAETGDSRQVRDVAKRSGEKIVDADDRVVLREQAVTQMRADESGGAGKNDPQTSTSRQAHIVADSKRIYTLDDVVFSFSNCSVPRPRLLANWR